MEILCADHSRTVQEALIGTAPRANVWFLLEYNGTWGAKALAQSTLSDTVKAHLAVAETLPHTRFQFIRQPERISDVIAFFVIDARTARLNRFSLNSYDDLLGLDLENLIGSVSESNESVYLVCTNGKRDPSCAKYGLAVYAELREVVGEQVWQTTHLGGHRFAGTAAFLPRGEMYGFIEPSQVAQLIAHYQQGKIHLPNYRGRSIYAEPVQAAEGFLLNLLGIHGVQLVSHEAIGKQHSRVVFHADSTAYIMEVYHELSEYRVYKSTGDPETVQVPVFRVELLK